ncbi:MAG: hypothetical protein KJ706_10225 [Candidatus Omnitrophica bacterium]|nr:hypothetical protein [Candidatus Omnitrophota bacterium]MBU4590150.1 hypothetical protein [Candidatus Omnitrophota bacterium]
MIRHRTILVLMLAVAIVFIAQSLCYAAGSRELTIVFTGDMRGELENCHCPKDDFGGLDRRYKYISGVREEVGELLLVDVGDVLSLATADLTEDEIARNGVISFKAMELMGYDVMNAGETDIVLGEDFLSERAEEVSFPFISANIIDKYTQEPYFRPYIVKTMESGLKVGILGVSNERYILNSDRLEIEPNKKAVARYLAELKSKSDIVIVLGHLGMPYSVKLAENIEGIDLILNGHWDTDSQEPIEVNGTLIMPTTYHSRKIGRLDLDVYGGQISSYKWESTPLDEGFDGEKIVDGIIAEMPELETQKTTGLVTVEDIALDRPLRVLVFYTAGCKACMEIERDLLTEIEERYGDSIVIENYDIGKPQNYEQMTRLEKLYGVEGGFVPEVIVSRQVLMGKEEIALRLDEVIHDALEEPIDLKKNQALALEAAKYQEPTRGIILSRFESFSVYTVLSAGLLDGVNPCAFTTIVFFISFLAFVGYRRREMFFAGLSFTLAVFFTYLLIGLGIFRFLRAMKAFGYVTVFINTLIGALAILLGILSLVDYFRFKKSKDSKSIILKLPQAIKNKIHSVIGSDFRKDKKSEKRNFWKIIWIALSAGFMVSLLESFCTGQVYLPTIAFVLKMPDKSISAFLYLIMYNLAFIAPLVAVFFLGLFGVTSNAFSRFMEKRLGLVKLSTAALFFLLAAVLIILR